MQLTKEFCQRFVRQLQGRDFILYGGLLELVKQRGLRRIDTKIIQIPNKENGMYAVVQAEIETEDGVFQEIGDASPESVNRQIAPHILRMASTRAKARAMRDAVGIDMVALEELSDFSESGEEPEVSEYPKQPEDVLVSFGKYTNRTLGEIYHVDRGYVEWLSINARDELVKRAARHLLGRETGRGKMETNNQGVGLQ